MREILPLVLLSIIIVSLFGCAPKKIRVYEGQEEIRNRIVEVSLSLLGKPYMAGGKGPERFDCSGLIHYVFKKVNIDLPISTEKLIKVGIEVAKENVLPGDIVFFKIQKDLHAGIMLNKEEFIHASKAKGVGVDSLRSPYWERRVLTFRSVIF
ncbi:MAG: C40 family peptidase [Desulfobacterota bacterium]|nr:C40 family peptidase [Thermodesulfobacteriota bacterium]MDW8002423.1 C40 family peptidase [Deltaproteobacteria bacterium]